jgi:putative FmdB family regulatory protein
MPIYEYTCQKCGAQLEVMQKISDKPLSRHARCGGRLAKQWSQTSFQLKGSGWYVTDYAGKKTEATESKESKAESSTKTESSDAKKETKETKETKVESAGAKEPKESKKPKASAVGGD